MPGEQLLKTLQGTARYRLVWEFPMTDLSPTIIKSSGSGHTIRTGDQTRTFAVIQASPFTAAAAIRSAKVTSNL